MKYGVTNNHRWMSEKGRTIIAGPYPPPHGGVASFNQALLVHLKERKPLLWAYSSKRPPLEGSALFEGRRCALIAMMLRQGRRATVIDSSSFLIEYPSYPKFAAAWLFLKHICRFFWVKILHDGTLPVRFEQFDASKRRAAVRAIRRVDAFIVVDARLKDWLTCELKVQQPVCAIPSLLPLTDDMIAATVPDSVDSFFKNHESVVCSSGVFTPLYGFLEVATAVERLRQRTRRDIGLVLADSGFSTDAAYRKEVVEGRPWVTVFDGLSRESNLSLVKRSDVFVRAVKQEAYGISRVESIVCGTPAVTTAVGETRGMLLYDSGNVHQLVSQLDTALTDPPIRSMERWSQVFRREAVANLLAMQNVFDSRNKAG